MTESYLLFSPEQIVNDIDTEFGLDWSADVILSIFADYITQHGTQNSFKEHCLRAVILEKDHTIRRLREQR